MYEEYLMHYGRLGMKWGQHIFGKDRSSETRRAKRISRKQKRANAIAVRRQKRANAIAEYRKKEAQKRKQKILSDPNLLYKHRKEFSEKELKDAISSIKRATEIKDLRGSVIDKGKRFVDGYISAADKISKVITGTKALNTATGGVLFRIVDDKLKSNDIYKTIKEQIEPFMTKPEDKDKKK